jgi:hypothetical protein
VTDARCRHCRTPFGPRAAKNVFCSRACSGKAHAGRKRDGRLRAEVWRLRECGLTYREIAESLNRCLSGVGRLVLSMELEGGP